MNYGSVHGAWCMVHGVHGVVLVAIQNVRGATAKLAESKKCNDHWRAERNW